MLNAILMNCHTTCFNNIDKEYFFPLFGAMAKSKKRNAGGLIREDVHTSPLRSLLNTMEEYR